MNVINAADLKAKLDANEDFVLVNVLSEDSFAQRHIPKSINIPVDQLASRARELPKDKPIIVYCASTECQASTKAAIKLEELGFTDVTDFEAGIAGWKEAGYEFEGNDG